MRPSKQSLTTLNYLHIVNDDQYGYEYTSQPDLDDFDVYRAILEGVGPHLVRGDTFFQSDVTTKAQCWTMRGYTTFTPEVTVAIGAGDLL